MLYGLEIKKPCPRHKIEKRPKNLLYLFLEIFNIRYFCYTSVSLNWSLISRLLILIKKFLNDV